MDKIKIYTLSDPLYPNEIRYVGKTKQPLNRRLCAHICDAKRRKLKTYNANWIYSLLKQGRFPIIIELDEIICNTKKEWSELEKYWILQMKCWGFNLTNMTAGGDGNQNQIFSSETLHKKSLKLKGKKRSKEICEKISKGSKGKKLTQKHKDNVRTAIILKQGRKILQFDLNDKYIQEWECIKSAANYYNIDSSTIMRCCQGKFKTAAKFKWKYKN